ncbi:transcriptional repressor NrdR [Candidatus Kinetoplastibacterium desouzaii TCC079E]|uniref:Transcriptional repressor NrdR n=1 Tax=Candidatus Kinetoplastidibacterium desouzai TCC079E TaxID=1208919 RepID=M1M4L6_9PROT|nr:transcriptional regulator NrdR [Candidatus Kinetoplastibacterium desouzaii]AGF47150.1 transcriptional repressor NrdR [Candidatus Kinetoplastibacterium desouzaii TCC079E]
MKCPFCGQFETQVIDSRVSDDKDSIRRRRRCLLCDKRFTTYEKVELLFPFVIKKNGSRCDYDVNKIRRSMLVALRKRSVKHSDLEKSIFNIEKTILSTGLRDIATDYIGELVMRELKTLDKVAYVRFVSVYKSFKNIDEFIYLIKEVG